jgi:hypothetical protein
MKGGKLAYALQETKKALSIYQEDILAALPLPPLQPVIDVVSKEDVHQRLVYGYSQLALIYASMYKEQECEEAVQMMKKYCASKLLKSFICFATI